MMALWLTFLYMIQIFFLLAPANDYKEGDVIEHNCSIPNTHRQFDAADIIFKLQNLSINKTYITRISNITASLKLAHLEASINSYCVRCFLPNITRQFSSICGIQVGRLPIVPFNFTCKLFSLEKLKCTWLPGHQEQNAYTKYAPNKLHLKWTNRTIRKWLDCPGLHDTECEWNGDLIQYGSVLYVKVYVSNVLGTVVADVQTVNTTYIVQPKEINGVHVYNVTCCTVMASWNHPHIHNIIPLQYHISWTSQLQPNKTLSEQVTNLSRVLLTDLTPYTNYTLTVRAKPIAGGFLSNSVSTFFSTSFAAPSHPPNASKGSFEIINDIDSTWKHIKVMWKELKSEFHNGPNLVYEVRIESKLNCLLTEDVKYTTTTMITSYIFQMRTGCQANVTINAYNTIGNHVYPKVKPMPILVDLTHQVSYPDVYVKAVLDDEVHLLWKPFPPLLHQEANITLHWCQTKLPYVTSNITCQGNLDWVTVPASRGMATLTLADHYSHYIFGASLEDNGWSTGIMWTSCIHDDRKGPSSPVLKTSPIQPNNGIHLEWGETKCSDQGLVSHYIISYCPVVECEENHKCNDDNETTLSRTYPKLLSGSSQVILDGLEPEASYRMWAISISSGRRSLPSNQLCLKVTKHWMSQSVWAGLLLAYILGVPLLLAGIIVSIMTCYRNCQRWFVVDIIVPEPIGNIL